MDNHYLFPGADRRGQSEPGIRVAVHHGELRLAELVPQVGMKYQAAAQAVKRYGQALVNDPARKRFVAKLRHALSTI